MIERVDAAMRDLGAAATLDAEPWLGAAIEADAAAGRFAGWATSTVVDENTGTAILSREVFEALHARARITATWPVGNAGLLHVYGYLLSTAPTPYGLKRERWLGADLARACGLPDDAFVPWSSPRTLLDRATSAAERLFSRAPLVRERLETGVTGVTALAARGDGSQGTTTALGYALESEDVRRFVTLFPIDDAPAVRRELRAGPPRLRWNAAR
ncbi:amino acid deaminase [Microbacterium sp.]|uniref:amino acid deaminase n=1 Tax=Microbacterium sp. TaxID=51671 RepID=UPI00289A3F82|nr:amino acid deaminase [Microbacterium sp.]